MRQPTLPAVVACFCTRRTRTSRQVSTHLQRVSSFHQLRQQACCYCSNLRSPATAASFAPVTMLIPSFWLRLGGQINRRSLTFRSDVWSAVSARVWGIELPAAHCRLNARVKRASVRGFDCEQGKALYAPFSRQIPRSDIS